MPMFECYPPPFRVDGAYGSPERWVCLQLLSMDTSKAFLSMGDDHKAALTPADVSQLKSAINKIEAFWNEQEKEKRANVIKAKVDAIMKDPEIRAELDRRYSF